MHSSRASVFWVLLLSALLLSARTNAVPTTRSLPLSPHQGKKESLERLSAQHGHPTTKEETMSKLMEDKCDDIRDVDECLKTRMMSEAHLDYIYTQDVRP